MISYTIGKNIMDTETGTILIEDFIPKPFAANGDPIDPVKQPFTDEVIEYIELQDSIYEGKKSEIIRDYLRSFGDPALEEEIYHSIWPFPEEKELKRPIWIRWFDPSDIYVQIDPAIQIPSRCVRSAIIAASKKAIAVKIMRFAHSDCSDVIVAYLEAWFTHKLTEIFAILKASNRSANDLNIPVLRDAIVLYYRLRKMIEFADALLRYCYTTVKRRDAMLDFVEMRRELSQKETLDAAMEKIISAEADEEISYSEETPNDRIASISKAVKDVVFEEIDDRCGTDAPDD